MKKYLVASGMQDDNTPIEILDLTVRAYNSLKRNKINTIHQLLALQKQELLGIRTLTPRSYEEIRERLIVCQFMHPMQPVGPFADDTNDDEVTP